MHNLRHRLGDAISILSVVFLYFIIVGILIAPRNFILLFGS